MRPDSPRPWRLGALLAVILAAAPAAAMTPPPPTVERAAPPMRPAAAVVYRMELLRIGKPTPEVIAGLQPLKSLPEVEAFLKAHDITFGWSRGDVPSASLPPGLVQTLNRLAPNTVFAMPQPEGALAIGVILGTRMADPAGAPGA